MTTTTTPATAAVPTARGPEVAPPAATVLVARTIDDVPPELPPGLVVVLPGGFRMWSGQVPGPGPPPHPHAPEPGIAVPEVVPPDARQTRARAAELTRLVAEVLAGRRAPAQLGGLATPLVLRYLRATRAGVAARPALASAGRGGRAGTPGCGAPATARPARVHVTQPHPDAAEVCATVPIAGRPRALALRLDRTAGDAPWVVTAVRLV
ncbi:Rv3235 family protein [Pseudonocardia parietis]|uniref:Uncharacterized protein n=1 Tax=Pseudonocardia parietis TaxID=570936 RepID=A0ABS4VQ39_9PSEU|nr:Rv3235 family protein [Pseudonocardia parietis]MBP2366031.1 hypothetical protein [Pseudonocardia parietis]